MRLQQKHRLFINQQAPKPKIIDQFYDPLLQIIKPIKPLQSEYQKSQFCVTLFQDEEENQDFICSKYSRKKNEEIAKPSTAKNNILKKIIENTKNPRKIKSKYDHQVPVESSEYEPFCFNNNIILKYPQTPHFKNQLQSPFYKFNSLHRDNMELLKNKTIKSDFQSIEIGEDPLNYVSQCIKYFIGLALKMKELGCNSEARAFHKLACFVEPFNDKSWKKYIECEQSLGYIYKSFILSKTAYLFTKNDDFVKNYLVNGQKCGISLKEMRGVITANANENIDKNLLIELGKLHLKHKPIWKGLKILQQICNKNDYKLPVCSLILFLAKYLQNIGQRQKGLYILKKSFNRSMSKLEIYTTYLEMKMRQDNGILRDNIIRQLLDYIDYISSENRYKLYLQIASVLYIKKEYTRFKHFVEQAFSSAKKYCASGSGCNKILKLIYYSVLKWKNIEPPCKPMTDITKFQSNRHLFLNKNEIVNHEFTDWKYYLHYGLSKRDDVIFEAYKKWSYTGRLLAEWIHVIRTKIEPKQVLSIWREKIDEVPKSGELWCQGGRIYAELHQYENASKCFRAAIHFTPQYGDSFIEQLKILMKLGKFYQVEKLRKIMFVSQPFYGHVWSFLRESRHSDSKLSTIQMWLLACLEIKRVLYRDNITCSNRRETNLTAYEPYNSAFLNPNSFQIRKKLFISYEQLDNKN